MNEVIGRLGQLGTKAVAVLDGAMESGVDIKVRLAAAAATLRNLREYRQAGELEERLEQVEALLERPRAALDGMEGGA